MKTEETFSDMQNLKNDLLPMHLFTGGEGVRQGREGGLGKAYDRKGELRDDSEERPREEAVQQIKRPHSP